MQLITGATGPSGAAILRSCSVAGLPVRGLVRDLAKAKQLGLDRLPDIELVEGDLRNPADVRLALEGISACILISGARQDLVATQVAFIDASAQIGLSHIIKFSGAESGVGFDASRFRGTRAHEQVERHLRDSDIAWTMLRPSQFMQMYLREPPTVAASGALIRPMGGAAISPIDIQDIARICVEILRQPDAVIGESLEITGPEALTMEEVSEIVSEAAGHNVSYVNIEPGEYHQLLVGENLGEDMIGTLEEIYAERRRCLQSRVSLETHRRFGVRPTTFAEFAIRNADAFRPKAEPA